MSGVIRRRAPEPGPGRGRTNRPESKDWWRISQRGPGGRSRPGTQQQHQHQPPEEDA
jgi:hypothetical protein